MDHHLGWHELEQMVQSSIEVSITFIVDRWTSLRTEYNIKEHNDQFAGHVTEAIHQNFESTKRCIFWASVLDSMLPHKLWVTISDCADSGWCSHVAGVYDLRSYVYRLAEACRCPSLGKVKRRGEGFKRTPERKGRGLGATYAPSRRLLIWTQ